MEKSSKSTDKQREKKLGGVTGKGFKPGPDPRRNLKGRPTIPKSQREMAELLVELSAEEVEDPGGVKAARLVHMLRRMFFSRNPKDHSELLDRMLGKVPQPMKVDVSEGSSIRVWKDFINADENPDTETDSE